MNSEKILKNILWCPDEAFKPEILEQTFSQSVLTFCFVALVGSALTTSDQLLKFHFLQRHPQIVRAPHLAAAIFFLITFMIHCGNAWLIGKIVEWKGGSVKVKSLITGALWISAVMLPVGGALHWALRLLSTPIIFIYRMWLMTMCIRSLTGFTTKKSFKVYILSLVLLFVVSSIVPIALALTLKLRRPVTYLAP